MSITPRSPDPTARGKVSTWVTSQWKLRSLRVNSQRKSTALEEQIRDRVPLDWALTQNSLGTGLRLLGERESGTERLEEAVTAYRAALEVRTRDRVPLGWAITQNNLGIALHILGERESGTERLEEAVTAYRAALEEFTREQAPYWHEMTERNLSKALTALRARKTG